MQSASKKRTFAILGLVTIVLLVGVWAYFGFSIEFMRFFAAAPPPTPSPTPIVINGGVVLCSPATQTVAIGAAATLSAASGTGAYSWFAPEGSLTAPTGGNVSVTYTTAGTKKVTVQAARGGGIISCPLNGSCTNANSIYTDSITCTVVVTGP